MAKWDAKRLVPWAVAIVFAAIALALALRVHNEPVRDNAPLVQWEYAERGVNNDPIKPKKPYDFWDSPEKSFESEDYTDFYHKLGGVGEPKNGEIDILNAVGRDGWELIYKEKDDLIFKRRVR